MLAQLHLKHPHVKVHNEVVEPSNDMLHKYKGASHCIDISKPYMIYKSTSEWLVMLFSFGLVRVSTTPDLDHINFTWNKMTASEFERHWQEKNPGEKMDFIHMIQVLSCQRVIDLKL